MSLLTVVLVLAVIGVITYLIDAYIPMNATIKKILNVVIIIATILWLLRVFDLMKYIDQLRI